MIVAGLQLDIAWQDPAENFARTSVLAHQATERGSRFLVLPEMFSVGFTMDVQRASAAADDTAAFLADLARRHSAWVAGGLAEPAADGGRPANACAVFAPDGREVGRYRKIHPFTYGGEDRHYAAGDQLLTVNVEGLRVTPVICYDLRFPEIFRAAAEDTDLFLVLANWPASRAVAWRCLLAARAIENQAYVLGVNRVGVGDAIRYGGESVLHHPFGQALADAGSQPAVVSGPVDTAVVAQARARYGFLSDRRPDVYARLRAAGG